jgi:hypothetical protein
MPLITAPQERRVETRQPCDLRVLCSLHNDDGRLLPGRLVDLSCSGVRVVLARWVEEGALLTVLVNPTRGFAPYTLQVRVVRVGRHADAGWLLGCQTIPPLSDADLDDFFHTFPPTP